jgi:acetyl esterase/lipase
MNCIQTFDPRGHVTNRLKGGRFSGTFALIATLVLSGCTSRIDRCYRGAAPHLQPVPTHISPEAQAFLKRTREDINENYVQEMGAIHRKAAPDLKTTEVEVGEVKCFWVTSPKTVREDVVVVYLHGGAFIYGSGEEGAGVFLPVYEELGVRALSVDYRLAPEHPFPAALNDVIAVYRGLLEQGYPPEKIAFLGDSAGGDLALAAGHVLKGAGDPFPAAIAVTGVWTDYYSTDDASIILKDWDAWQDLETDDIWIPAYVGDNDLRNPLISPLYGDFTGFPPLLVHSATREIDLSGGIRLAQKARRQGVDVTLDVWDGMWHVWHMMWPDVPESRQACLDIAVFLRKHLKMNGR